LSDYWGSGYDRGHLVPAGDMTRSELVMRESFLLSNMSPQVPAFNRGIWKVLEDKVRGLARRHKDIVVVTGALFLEDKKFIGASWVGVPSHYYIDTLTIGYNRI
jgi:endonuclease G, mitochondrial